MRVRVSHPETTADVVVDFPDRGDRNSMEDAIARAIVTQDSKVDPYSYDDDFEDDPGSVQRRRSLMRKMDRFRDPRGAFIFTHLRDPITFDSFPISPESIENLRPEVVYSLSPPLHESARGPSGAQDYYSDDEFEFEEENARVADVYRDSGENARAVSSRGGRGAKSAHRSARGRSRVVYDPRHKTSPPPYRSRPKSAPLARGGRNNNNNGNNNNNINSGYAGNGATGRGRRDGHRASGNYPYGDRGGNSDDDFLYGDSGNYDAGDGVEFFSHRRDPRRPRSAAASRAGARSRASDKYPDPPFRPTLSARSASLVRSRDTPWVPIYERKDQVSETREERGARVAGRMRAKDVARKRRIRDELRSATAKGDGGNVRSFDDDRGGGGSSAVANRARAAKLEAWAKTDERAPTFKPRLSKKTKEITGAAGRQPIYLREDQTVKKKAPKVRDESLGQGPSFKPRPMSAQSRKLVPREKKPIHERLAEIEKHRVARLARLKKERHASLVAKPEVSEKSRKLAVRRGGDVLERLEASERNRKEKLARLREEADRQFDLSARGRAGAAGSGKGGGKKKRDRGFNRYGIGAPPRENPHQAPISAAAPGAAGAGAMFGAAGDAGGSRSPRSRTQHRATRTFDDFDAAVTGRTVATSATGGSISSSPSRAQQPPRSPFRGPSALGGGSAAKPLSPSHGTRARPPRDIARGSESLGAGLRRPGSPSPSPRDDGRERAPSAFGTIGAPRDDGYYKAAAASLDGRPSPRHSFAKPRDRGQVGGIIDLGRDRDRDRDLDGRRSSRHRDRDGERDRDRDDDSGDTGKKRRRHKHRHKHRRRRHHSDRHSDRHSDDDGEGDLRSVGRSEASSRRRAPPPPRRDL